MPLPGPIPVFEQAPLSMVLYDPAGRALAVNAAFENLFGLRIDQVPPDYTVLTDPELERQGALPLVRRAFEGEHVRVGPIHYNAPSLLGAGKETWTYGHFFPIRDAEGALRHVVLVHVDLTEHVETEHALLLATKRYRALIDATSALVWSTDAQGMIDDMPAWRELTGQSREEVSGEGWANALHPDDRARAREVWWDAYRRRVPYVNEYRLRLRDGSYRWMRARAVPLLGDDGQILEWIGTLDDIHYERVADERKLFLEEASRILNASLEWEPTLRALARHCVPFLADYASVDLVDETGEIQRVETAHGDPVKESIVRELWSAYPYRKDEPYGVPEVLRSGQPQLVPSFPWEQVRQFSRDARHLELLTTLNPQSYVCVPLMARGRTLGALSLVYSDSGRTYTAMDVGVAMELASRAAIAIENARLYRETESANRAKGEFLAMMSHELRTPLNGIAGHAELLELGVHGGLNAEQLEALRRIQKNQRHLLAMVNDLLNFARVEAGSVHYDIRPVSLDQVIADAESVMRPQLEARKLTLVCAPLNAPVLVLADHEKLLQILLNLLSNAAKFTDSGGTVSLSVQPAGDRVAIAVRDTGRGIPPDKLQVIFEPFVQLDRSLSRSSDGAGLGLAISRDLARAMNGDLRVDSVMGAGSTFTLTMPVST